MSISSPGGVGPLGPCNNNPIYSACQHAGRPKGVNAHVKQKSHVLIIAYSKNLCVVISDFHVLCTVFWLILNPSKTEHLFDQPTILRIESESSCPRNPWVLFLGPEDDISRSIWGVRAVTVLPRGVHAVGT